jgi:hypothetical protein
MRNYSIEHFPSRCLCGSKICRGSVTGWKDLPDDWKEAYQGFVAPYLLELDRNEPVLAHSQREFSDAAHRRPTHPMVFLTLPDVFP